MAALAGCSSNDTPAAPAPARNFTVKVIGFNDYHGNLQSPGTFGVNTSVSAASRPAVGGAEVLAAYVAKLKAANPLNVVVARATSSAPLRWCRRCSSTSPR